MHDNGAHLRAQADRFLRERLRPAVYRARERVELARWDVPGEPVPAAEAITAEYTPYSLGQAWGRPWGTTWFRVRGTVPQRWAEEQGAEPELIVDVGFNDVQTGFQAEATAYTRDGRIIKAVEPLNRYVTLSSAPGEAVEVFIEAAANPDVINDWTFTPTPMGSKATAGEGPLYQVRELAIGLRDKQVAALIADLEVLLELADEVGHHTTRGSRILAAVGRAVQAVDPANVSGTASRGRAELEEELARPATASAHQVVAVGHAHIDSAWLWPVRETVRKVARTFSNVLALMDEHDDIVFAASSAQQFAWLQEHYPELFERVRRRVAEGRFIPVGGMWVESDTNLPGGEGLVRQFVHGTRYFREQFGVDTTVVWLPDSFGYTAALPQIIAQAGARWFLTQKLSWNETNRIPHHTFRWEGLDGTRVFTHFPPVDKYNSDLSAADLARAERQFAEKAGASSSLVPYGYGDGGGGPTREMLDRAHRTADLEGSPQVQLASPQEFFARAEAEYPQAPVWSGELYLEFHRGTYTSQARTKRGNRRSETLLREAELWATAAAVRTGAPYPYEALESLWQTVLLQQFHDILPGTSIAWVHREAEENYRRVATELEALIADSLQQLVGEGEEEWGANAGPLAVEGLPAMTIGQLAPTPEAVGATRGAQGAITLTSPFATVVVAADGTLTSVVDAKTGREAVPPGEAINVLEVFRDTPNQWDAWDIDADYRFRGTELRSVERVELTEHDGVPVVLIERTYGNSTVRQEISLAADRPAVTIRTHVDWHEQQKLLKLAFGVDVHAERATSEVQFGHVHRPTHVNTSWDEARFETPAQRWVHVGEAGYGFAVINDAIHGHDVSRDTRAEGGSTTLVRQSLLRAPLYPDPEADQGEHTFTTVLRPGATIGDAIEEGYRLALPVRRLHGAAGAAPLFTVDNPAMIVEAVKLAEDRSGDVVVRVYESLGGRAQASIDVDPALDAAGVTRTDLHEQPSAEPNERIRVDGRRLELDLRPFEIVTLRLPRASDR